MDESQLTQAPIRRLSHRPRRAVLEERRLERRSVRRALGHGSLRDDVRMGKARQSGREPAQDSRRQARLHRRQPVLETKDATYLLGFPNFYFYAYTDGITKGANLKVSGYSFAPALERRQALLRRQQGHDKRQELRLRQFRLWSDRRARHDGRRIWPRHDGRVRSRHDGLVRIGPWEEVWAPRDVSGIWPSLAACFS